jgi:hypothetical protein
MRFAADRMRASSTVRRTRRLALAALALIALASAAAAAFASPARASYRVTQCTPGDVNYAEAAWQPFGSTGFSIWGTNECYGGGYGLRLDTSYNGAGTGYTGNGSGLAWRFTAPSGTRFASASASLHYGDNGGFAAAYFSDGSPSFSVPDGGSGAPSLFTTATVSNATLFELRMQCFSYPNCHSTWSYLWATNFLAKIDDAVPPQVSASGSLLNGSVVRGNQTLDATASDVGGGVSSISVYVNGVPSRSAAICPPDRLDGSYTHLKPCPDSASRTIPIDTEHDPGWSNGPNDLMVCAADAGEPAPAGGQNVSQPCLHRTVEVDNTCPGSGGTAAQTLDAGVDLAGKLADRGAITSNAQPVIRGVLRDGAGAPVAGATVCIYQTIGLPDASRELATSVTTQPNGRFASRLDSGPSRELDLVYRHNDQVLAQRVELDSTVVPTLTLARKRLVNGRAERFAGELPGPGADGRAVALQARAGRKWRTFKQLRSDSEGRFKGTYRFTQTTGVQRYAFRVLVKRQSGYPYEPGSSRKRTLIVRG